MKIIDQYLGKTILQTIGLVVLAVLGLEIFILLIGELGDIGNGKYTVFSAFIFVLLSLPQTLYELFPMAGLLGMLMGLGLLANHSELIILQGAGLSPLKIALGTLKTILMLVITVTLLGEVIAPMSNGLADSFKESRIHTNAQHTDLASDVWLRINNNYLHISRIDEQKVLHGVSWYQFNDQNELFNANRAQQVAFTNSQWIATQIDSTHFGSNGTTSSHQATQEWPFSITPEMLQNTVKSPDEMSLHQLRQAVDYHKEMQNSTAATQLAFWRRLIQPIASLVMMLLAIPFIFGPLRHANHSFRLVAGIAVGFAFYYANQFFGPISLLLHWPPALGAILPTLIFAAVGILLLQKK